MSVTISPILEDLLKNQEIEFLSYGTKLDTDIDNLGAYNLHFIRSILRQSGSYVTIRGKTLQNYLTQEANLYLFATFIDSLWREGVSKVREEPAHFAIHVEVNVNTLGEHYPYREKMMVDGAGEVFEVTEWAPNVSRFDKVWSFIYYQANFETGMEHPRDDASFRYQLIKQAEKCMFGTPEQLTRYEDYVLDPLLRKQQITDHHRIITQNIAHFRTRFDGN